LQAGAAILWTVPLPKGRMTVSCRFPEIISRRRVGLKPVTAYEIDDAFFNEFRR
jgi:hypothetical protein